MWRERPPILLVHGFGGGYDVGNCIVHVLHS
jgi:hypothetical protein